MLELERINKDIIKYNLIDYFNFEELFGIINLGKNSLIKWKNIDYRRDYINNLYEKLIDRENKNFIFFKEKTNYNQYLIDSIFNLIENDKKNELDGLLLYNIFLQFIHFSDIRKIIYLIEKYNIDLSIPDNYALIITIKNNNNELFNFLMNNESVVKNINSTILYTCCIHKNYDFLMIIFDKIKNEFNINEYRSALFYACERGALRIVKYIIENNKVKDIINDNKLYLSASISSGNINLVKYMFNEVGFNIKHHNQLAIRTTCENGHLHILKYLLEFKEVEPEVNNNYCLRVCCKKNYISLVEVLLEDERVNPYDMNYECFMICCKFDYFDIFKLLVEYNKNIDLTFNNNILFKIAEYYDNKDIIEYLRK